MFDSNKQSDIKDEELEGGNSDGYVENLEKEKTIFKMPEISSMDLDEEESSSHFMAYSLIAIIIIMATYIMYHNKQRVGSPYFLYIFFYPPEFPLFLKALDTNGNYSK